MWWDVYDLMYSYLLHMKDIQFVNTLKCCLHFRQRNIMLISDVLPVMVDDALLSSHPIIVNVSTPAEITSVFDGISYSKVKHKHP